MFHNTDTVYATTDTSAPMADTSEAYGEDASDPDEPTDPRFDALETSEMTDEDGSNDGTNVTSEGDDNHDENGSDSDSDLKSVPPASTAGSSITLMQDAEHTGQPWSRLETLNYATTEFDEQEWANMANHIVMVDDPGGVSGQQEWTGTTIENVFTVGNLDEAPVSYTHLTLPTILLV